MRTTLDIDDDVLAAAKELARRQKATAGQVVSRLLREALSGRPTLAQEAPAGTRSITGFRPFPPANVIITNDRIDELRDAEGV